MDSTVTGKKGFFMKDTLLMFGPAWLAMMADMDVSSFIGAAQTGATFGYGLIWVMIILIIPLYVVQELAGRISIATKDGLGAVVRKYYGKRIASLVSFPMALTDVVTYGIEYLGIGIGLEIMGISLYYSIPVVYVIHIAIVTRRKYRQAEKPLILISVVLVTALLISLFFRGIMPLDSTLGNPLLIEPTSSFFFLLAANVGAVIMPFMIFFQASATGTKLKELKNSGFNINRHRSVHIMRKETLMGAMATEMLMVIAEMAFTGIPRAENSSFFATPAELGKVLIPIAGSFSPYIFGIGIIAAGFIALITISMGSAWGVAEALGISKRSYWIVYVLESIPAVVAVLVINPASIIGLVLYLLIFFVFALVAPMVMLWTIGRNRKIMGDMALGKGNQLVYLCILVLIVSTAVIAVVT
jgi:Mn2+/Fe2+ NRAMP family transporter